MAMCLNFILTRNYGAPSGYPKLNILINQREKEYLQDRAWNGVPLRCEYKVDDNERNQVADCDIFLKAVKGLNKHYYELQKKTTKI